MAFLKNGLLTLFFIAVPTVRAAENSIIYPQMQHCFNALNNSCSLDIAKIILATSAGALGGILIYDALLEELKKENKNVDAMILSTKERSFWWGIAALLCASCTVDKTSHETLRWVTKCSGICIATFGLLFCANTINRKMSALLDRWLYDKAQPNTSV